MSDGEKLHIKVDDKALIAYQASPMSDPRGGEKFSGSNFIHPLKTPSGFTVTDIQPDDHYHHFGLWWPWKFLETEGRKVLFWELQGGEGIIQAQRSQITEDGFTEESIFLDRKNPNGPTTLLNETVNVKISPILDEPAKGYYLNVEIIQEAPTDTPVTVSVNTYSGLTLRGARNWDAETSFILTSEGKEREETHATRAKWVLSGGDAEDGEKAGVLMMSHPDNHNFPELLRTWDKQHDGAIFVNFNPVQEEPWEYKPGQKYIRNYRVFIFDGTISSEDSEKLWKEYIENCP